MMTAANDITDEAIQAMAALVGLTVPQECLPGVAANLRLLAEHAARLPAAEEVEA